MNNKQFSPSETRYDDLIGVVSINLKENENFNAVAAKLAGYNPQQFIAVALRVFIQESPVVTIYAQENSSQEVETVHGKLKVHKFKIDMSLEQLFASFRQLNFTVTTGEYSIEDMEVVNA